LYKTCQQIMLRVGKGKANSGGPACRINEPV
jgi:hypothetical protein